MHFSKLASLTYKSRSVEFAPSACPVHCLLHAQSCYRHCRAQYLSSPQKGALCPLSCHSSLPPPPSFQSWWPLTSLLSLWIFLSWICHVLLLFSHSVVSVSAIPRTAAHQASLSITISRSLLKLMSIDSVILSNHLILCCPLLHLLSISSIIKVFSNELDLHVTWPKYYSFSISPFNEYSGLISFRMDWFDILAVQGTLKSLLQHHSSKADEAWSLRAFV